MTEIDYADYHWRLALALSIINVKVNNIFMHAVQCLKSHSLTDNCQQK